MPVLHFLRFKYGPPVTVVTGVALLAAGAGPARVLVTGIIGAALVILGTAAGITRTRQSGTFRSLGENHRATGRSGQRADGVRGAATRTGSH